MISGDTWAIVAATGLGHDFVAVLITLLCVTHEIRSEHAASGYFAPLMATCRVNISPEHVNALNLVEVDFYACEMVPKALEDLQGPPVVLRAKKTMRGERQEGTTLGQPAV